jgi:hypothetical protein
MEKSRIETIKEVIDVWNSNSNLLLENSISFEQILYLALNQQRTDLDEYEYTSGNIDEEEDEDSEDSEE